ncbi:MAG: hypothetical protein EAZ97_02230 [Bacteroidetes bacterium]|nr:MAG: hypothetical protein EAZ97_02230 [Bacteroidota bacterium]
MQTSNFEDWTLTKLDKTFGLRQIWNCEHLQAWQNIAVEIDDFERRQILNLQKPLIRGGKAWNETELENKFISPMILISGVESDDIGYFLERPLKGIIGNYELSGIVDGMIATGFRDPDVPFFCMHEYKRSVDNNGNPDAQALIAMMVARDQNDNTKPIYGLYIVGLIWNFIVLNGNNYCISENYDGSNDGIFGIFKMLKSFKQIIKNSLL